MSAKSRANKCVNGDVTELAAIEWQRFYAVICSSLSVTLLPLSLWNTTIDILIFHGRGSTKAIVSNLHGQVDIKNEDKRPRLIRTDSQSRLMSHWTTLLLACNIQHALIAWWSRQELGCNLRSHMANASVPFGLNTYPSQMIDHRWSTAGNLLPASVGIWMGVWYIADNPYELCWWQMCGQYSYPTSSAPGLIKNN